MFKVGEFARLAQVSIRMLHYYDQIGLLCPATVDQTTGYRYYSAEQFTRLHHILALKDLGLSLEQVGKLVDGNLSVDELRGMLLLKQAELSQRVAEEQGRLDRVQQRLRFIEEAGKLPEMDVVIKSVPAMHVLSVRRAIQMGTTPHTLFYETWKALRLRGLSGAVEVMLCRYHTSYLLHLHKGLRPRRNLIEAAYVIDPTAAREDIPLEGGGWLRVRELPAVEMMACAVHRGPDNERHVAHRALFQWMSTQGYALAGPQREVYLWRARPDRSSDEHITEIELPVQRVDATSIAG